MLQISTVLPSTLKLLIRLQKTGVLKSTRLAGGTALALQLGHRMSVDLDFFGRVEGDSETIFETLSQDGFQVVPEMNSKNIHICQINGIKVDIVNYKHPWIDGMVEDKSVKLADIRDFAAMKIAAITNRGDRKDFVDLYFLLKYFSIQEIMNFYLEKYPDTSAFLHTRFCRTLKMLIVKLCPKCLSPLFGTKLKTASSPKCEIFEKYAPALELYFITIQTPRGTVNAKFVVK